MAQQIKKKFIQNDAVDGQKIKLQKDQSIRGQKQDGSEVELLKLDGSDKLVSGGQELAFKQVVDSQVSDLQGKLDSEKASRISGDETLQSTLNAEQSAREQADQGLQSQINTEKGRVDAILSASNADKDSFAEIVQLINSVDTENDSAFASYVLSNNTALASEVSSRQQGDQGLQSNIDAEKTRAMGEESRIESKFDGTMSTEQAARIAGDSAEQTRAMGVESSLQSQVTQEVSDRQSAVSSETSARQAADSTEQTARIAADADLQAQHDDLEGYAQDIRSDLDNLDGYAQDIRSDLDAEVIAIDLRLDVLEAKVDGPAFSNEKIIVGAELGFLELSMQVKKIMSCAVGRLAVHEGEDFDVTVVGGKSRIVWKGSLLAPSGEECIETGVNVFVVYAY